MISARRLSEALVRQRSKCRGGDCGHPPCSLVAPDARVDDEEYTEIHPASGSRSLRTICVSRSRQVFTFCMHFGWLYLLCAATQRTKRVCSGAGCFEAEWSHSRTLCIVAHICKEITYLP